MTTAEQRAENAARYARETGHRIKRCTGPGCSGCRDVCVMAGYESLACCETCGGLEGSLLPFCPGRPLTYAEDEANYEHYCNNTGPFARASVPSTRAVVEACSARCPALLDAVKALAAWCLEQDYDRA